MAPLRHDDTNACPKWQEALTNAFAERAATLFEKARYTEALSTTRASIDQYRQSKRDGSNLGDDRLHEIARQWLERARAAHPARPRVQHEAATNAWELYRTLADEQLAAATPAVDKLTDIAYRLNTVNLIGLLPTDLAVNAAIKTRDIYARLTAIDPTEDHRRDTAAAWQAQAKMLHPAQLDAQHEAARQAWELYRTLADEQLAAATPAVDKLTDIAYRLGFLQGLLAGELAAEAASLIRRIGSVVGVPR